MFDLDVILPVCSKFKNRIEDFKKYGLLNQRGRKVRVNLVLSAERVDGLEEGWRGDFIVRTIHNESPEYVANLYRFYLSVDPTAPGCRWLIRLDDDSCTDIDGLVSNLDRFYGSDREFYLGDLHNLQEAINGFEGGPYQEYRSFLGEYEPFGGLLRTEIECGVMSAGAISKVLSNERSRRLIEKRSTVCGGYGDCVVAVASAMAGVYPTDCPFITHQPLLHDFSMLKGVRNHIHMISRSQDAENFFYRCSPETFELLTRVADNAPSDSEKNLAGKRLLLENGEAIRILEIHDGYTARVKLDHRRFNWYESNGEFVILESGNVFCRIKALEDGSMKCDNFDVSVLKT
jgi:hypothetical protein